jgi:hypothetical protein
MSIKYIMQLDRRTFYLLIGVLVVMMILPLKDIFEPILQNFSFSRDSDNSIEHHLLLGKKFQTILIVYILIVFIAAYHYKNLSNKKLQWFIFFSVFILIVFYQHYYILNRLRSYFLPVLIVYLFQFLYSKNRFANTVILRQIFIVAILLYSINTIRAKYIDHNIILSKSHIYDTSTIFDRKNYSEGEIKKRQMRKAKIYWEEEFTKNDKNFVK